MYTLKDWTSHGMGHAPRRAAGRALSSQPRIPAPKAPIGYAAARGGGAGAVVDAHVMYTNGFDRWRSMIASSVTLHSHLAQGAGSSKEAKVVAVLLCELDEVRAQRARSVLDKLMVRQASRAQLVGEQAGRCRQRRPPSQGWDGPRACGGRGIKAHTPPRSR